MFKCLVILVAIISILAGCSDPSASSSHPSAAGRAPETKHTSVNEVDDPTMTLMEGLAAIPKRAVVNRVYNVNDLLEDAANSHDPPEFDLNSALS